MKRYIQDPMKRDTAALVAVCVALAVIIPLRAPAQAKPPNVIVILACVSACNFDPLSWGIGVQN